MPDLDRALVLEWFRLEEASSPSAAGPPLQPVEESPEVEAALVRLGGVLDDALGRAPDTLSAMLRASPAGDELRIILAQIWPARFLRILEWIMEGPLPGSDAVLAGFMVPDATASGQYLQRALLRASGPTALERIYAPERLQGLLAACQADAGLREAA
jgi:hypothetical protein